MKWIKVEDRLPDRTYVDYLVFPFPEFTYGDSYTAEYRGNGKWFIEEEDNFTSYDHEYKPTHWMPLPEPPEDE